jgi:hypothetical protein
MNSPEKREKTVNGPEKKRVHPFGALFLFGVLCPSNRIGAAHRKKGEASVEGSIGTALGTSKD